MHTNYPIPRPSNLGGAILMVGCVDKKKEITTDISEYLIFDNITDDTVNIRSISNKDKIVGNVTIPTTDKDGRTIVSMNIDNLDTNESPGFYGCQNVTSITTPSTLSNIGKYSFTNCSSLNKIVIEVGKDNFEQFNNLSSDLFDQNPNLKLVLRGEYTYNQNIKYITGYPWGINEEQIIAENGDIPLTEKDIPASVPNQMILYMASRDIMVKELDPNYENVGSQLLVYPPLEPNKTNFEYISYWLYKPRGGDIAWYWINTPDGNPVKAEEDFISKGHPFWFYKKHTN